MGTDSFSALRKLSSASVFVEKQGQFPAPVRFQVRAGGRTIWLTDAGLVFDSFNLKPNTKSNAPENQDSSTLSNSAQMDTERIVFREVFSHGSKTPKIEPYAPLAGIRNYLDGSDPAHWHTKIRSYSGVVYKDVWKGIDVKLYAKGQDVEQEFVLHPGTDLKQLQVAYQASRDWRSQLMDCCLSTHRLAISANRGPPSSKRLLASAPRYKAVSR